MNCLAYRCQDGAGESISDLRAPVQSPTEVTFNRGKPVQVLLSDKGNSNPSKTSACASSNAMDIILRRSRNIKVNNRVNRRNVYSSCGNLCVQPILWSIEIHVSLST
mmetsp:Transcript_33033/g.99588  ORF Transcript_33033/g.99588 Transcript_33033/m.99588 type:complete len:107 (-) Transcript_33033:1068-1388(-)